MAATLEQLIETLDSVRQLAADAQWTQREDKEVYWDAAKSLIQAIAQKIAE